MFDCLGDRAAQESIRAMNKQKTHCYILKRSSPAACAVLPYAVGEIPAGSPCPNNPYVRFAAEILRQESAAELLVRAEDAFRAAHGGALGPTAPSVEITMAHVWAQWLENRRTEIWLKSLSS